MNEWNETDIDPEDDPDRMINDLTRWRALYEEADSDWKREAILTAHRRSFVVIYGYEFDQPGVRERVMRAVDIEQEAIRGETELGLAVGCCALLLVARYGESGRDDPAMECATKPAH